MWEAATGSEIVRMTHDNIVTSVVFSPDGKFVASGSADNSIRIWEAGSIRETPVLTPDGSVFSVTFSPDGKYVGA